uniref:Uncharacterized protein n=1 Tax=Aegilops tauschii subsp. strangulata TaxID=200361 RepID=A0A453ANW3_AEGTS
FTIPSSKSNAHHTCTFPRHCPSFLQCRLTCLNYGLH